MHLQSPDPLPAGAGHPHDRVAPVVALLAESLSSFSVNVLLLACNFAN